MPRARRRKDSSFQPEVTKSIFLYGRPNKEKQAALQQMQRVFTVLVNRDIRRLADDPSVFLQVVKDDKKDPQMRQLEKSMRPERVNSAFCQNAFDMAVTYLSSRLDNIRLDLLAEGMDLFARSKVLFALSVTGTSRTVMAASMRQIGKTFHLECAEALETMPEETFRQLQMEFLERYASKDLEYRIPELKTVSVPLDSRLMRLEKAEHTASPYVIQVTDPLRPGRRIPVPLDTSRHSLHKIHSRQMAGTVHLRVLADGIRIGWSYTEKRKQPKTERLLGVDTGVTDAFHTSDDQAFGSLSDVIGFYKQEVEPTFAQLAALRNKKRKIRHYLRSHTLPADVRRSLIDKMDRLEQMMRTMDAPYRKKRHYYALLGQRIREAVDGYLRTVSSDTLTVLEKLDIREFTKSRTQNGKFSLFARGRLQQELMRSLNWKGYDFLEISPEYTSQACPVCSNLDPENRHLKQFVCTCCGYTADADYVGAQNIKSRAADPEILEACAKFPYQKKQRQEAIRMIYAGRNTQYTASM